MFNRKLLCIILSIILGTAPILQTFLVFATENSVVTESLSLYIQMMQKGEDKFEKNGSAEYVSGLQIDDCVLIDLEWISNKLGLLVEVIDVAQKDNLNTEDMSYDIQKYQEGQEKVFANDSTKKAIRIRKAENIYLQFILKTGSEKAFTYSPHLGEIVVDLGAEVTEQDGKVYVPFTMFLNLFDSYYILDEENVINLYPCETTVVDILHMTGLLDYYFDVIEDSGLSEFEIATEAGYDDFYRKIKALFQGVIHLDVDMLMKAIPNDKTVVAELLSKMLLTSSDNEFEKVVNASVINSNLGLLTTDFIKSQVEEGAEESLNETIRKWTEQRESRIQSTGFSSVDEALEFERQAATDIAREESVKANIESSCKKMTLGVNLVNIGFSAFVKYMTLVSEINSTKIFYVDAVKEYINGYNELQYPFMEKPIINVIEEKIKVYEKKETNPFKNIELLNEIFKTIGNTTTSLALNDVANYSVEQIATAYPSFKVKEFSKTWLRLQAVSIGWDIAELFVNKATNGSLEALDALHTSLYAMLLQTDAYNTLRSTESYQDLDEYRKLEWVRLRSYYITRQLILMFYQPQQLLHPEEYEIAMAPIENECNELIELMTVLAVGPTGLSKEKLDEVSKMREELDKGILKNTEEQGKQLEQLTKITNASDTDSVFSVQVSDAYTDVLKTWSSCYHIPQITVDGNTDFEINKNIYKDLYPMIESVKESERLYSDDSSWFPDTVSMLYTWGRKNDVISITVQTYGKYHEWQEYKTYYFSLSTYEMLTQNDILELYDLSENDFYTLAKNTMQRYWEYRTQILSSSELNESYILLEETLEDENVKSAEAIIDIDGNLCISAYISDPTNGYPYAQPYIINTTNPEQNFDWLSCDMDHFN